MAALTPLGKELRKFRIDRHQKLLEMAKDLDVSAAYLSAVEYGRKNVSQDLVEKIIAACGLDLAAAARLKEAAELSNKSVKIDLKDTGDVSRELALAFARNFGRLDDDDAKQMIAMLSSGREKTGSDGK